VPPALTSSVSARRQWGEILPSPRTPRRARDRIACRLDRTRALDASETELGPDHLAPPNPSPRLGIRPGRGVTDPAAAAGRHFPTCLPLLETAFSAYMGSVTSRSSATYPQRGSASCRARRETRGGHSARCSQRRDGRVVRGVAPFLRSSARPSQAAHAIAGIPAPRA